MAIKNYTLTPVFDTLPEPIDFYKSIDAGHSSGATTDRYIDVELAVRAKSAKNKVLEARKIKTP